MHMHMHMCMHMHMHMCMQISHMHVNLQCYFLLERGLLLFNGVHICNMACGKVRHLIICFDARRKSRRS